MFGVRVHPRVRAAALGLMAGVVVAAASGLAILDAPAASAATGCSGYAACDVAPYTNHGYDTTTNQNSYWDQYVGDNCTNYVAYLLITINHLPNEQPWSGTGNAYEWGDAMHSITDLRPAVGAVAWWESGYHGAGSLGHVAWVEQVSQGAIVVSEDSYPTDGVPDYSGDLYDWRVITIHGGRWPSGFIHFPIGNADDTTPPSSSPTPADSAASPSPSNPSSPSPTATDSTEPTPTSTDTVSTTPTPSAASPSPSIVPSSATPSSAPPSSAPPSGAPPSSAPPSRSRSPMRTPTRVVGYAAMTRATHGNRGVLVADQLPGDATGVVLFTAESGMRTCHAEVARGVARCALPRRLRPGRYRITAHYCGSSRYDGSSDTFTLAIPRS